MVSRGRGDHGQREKADGCDREGTGIFYCDRETKEF